MAAGGATAVPTEGKVGGRHGPHHRADGTQRPSAVTDATIGRRLRGGLDNIVLMALRKEPERRYPSVEQFSDDIRRHLEARPVLARRETPPIAPASSCRRDPAGQRPRCSSS